MGQRPDKPTHWTPERVKALRTNLGLTQREFAKRARRGYVAVARWETGVASPDAGSEAILDALEAGYEQRFSRREESALPWEMTLIDMLHTVASYVGEHGHIQLLVLDPKARTALREIVALEAKGMAEQATALEVLFPDGVDSRTGNPVPPSIGQLIWLWRDTVKHWQTMLDRIDEATEKETTASSPEEGDNAAADTESKSKDQDRG